jgi:hypothetical protein
MDDEGDPVGRRNVKSKYKPSNINRLLLMYHIPQSLRRRVRIERLYKLMVPSTSTSMASATDDELLDAIFAHVPDFVRKDLGTTVA